LKDGTLKLNKQAIREEEKFDRKYVIRTSDDTLSLEDVVLGYKQLLQVENAFRTLKSTLKIHPMYHRIERRIRAHIIINWLALLLVRLIENETGASWDSIRREVQMLHVGHFTT
jgi:transposase